MAPKVRQFYIALPSEIADALTAAAIRDDRPGKMQCVRYIVAGLKADGWLSSESDQPVPQRAVRT